MSEKSRLYKRLAILYFFSCLYKDINLGRPILLGWIFG